MVHDTLDLPLLLQVSDSNACEAAIDLQPLNEDRLADEPEGGNLLHDTVESCFVKGHSVDGLVFDLSLGPLLLLRRLPSAR